jgi:oxygen-independent coproporphyrinogen-3 oxidase
MGEELFAAYDYGATRYASYPPTSRFDAGVDAARYRRWLGEVPTEAVLALHVHVPFCQSLCRSCSSYTIVPRHYRPIETYVALLVREIELVAAVLGAPRPVDLIHLGGGTPTMLAPEDLRRLGRALRAQFRLLPDLEIAVDVDPRTLTLSGAAALREIGATRASLGVQDVSPKVQRIINRWQPLDVTERAVKWLRYAGIHGIELELLYGLPEQSAGCLLHSIEAVLGLAPDRVILRAYVHEPEIRPHQRLIDRRALPVPEARAAQFRAGAARLIEAGYVAVGIDHFARREDRLAVAQHAGRLRFGVLGYTDCGAAALIGLGASAVGTLPQGYVQNAIPIGAYGVRVRSGRLAVVRGAALTDGDRVRRAIIERLMCDLAVDLDRVCVDHGWPPERLQAERDALAALSIAGFVEISGGMVRVRPDARESIDAICAVFDDRRGAGDGPRPRAA